MEKKLIILGTRGIPASHGGFETFAEKLALYLVERDWEVIVYCQQNHDFYHGPKYSNWRGVELVNIPVSGDGAFATVKFDLIASLDSLKYHGIFLTLGYNTALFNILHWVFRKVNLINMDGIEWRRKKWGGIAKSWFFLNEKFGKIFGTALIADHPEIAKHLSSFYTRKKITTIPYGGDIISNADIRVLDKIGLRAHQYFVVIARPEPENSILEIVKAFSQSASDKTLVVLGNFAEDNEYHQSVKQFESTKILFPGAIYDGQIISSLRFFSLAYIHGHQVGGTNPSLIEAMAAGAPVIAHDNKFNRWVVGDNGLFFSSQRQLKEIFSENQIATERVSMSEKNKRRVEAKFNWDTILLDYEKCFRRYL